jgi:isopenicillin N synthase-like dioxygenase
MRSHPSIRHSLDSSAPQTLPPASRFIPRTGEETLDPKRQKSGDTKEGYYIGREVAKGSAEDGLPLRGPNNWPDERALGLAAFKEPMNAYYDAVCDLARRLMPSFETALGLEKDFFAGKFSHPTALLRPLKYAAAASNPQEGIMAAGAHSDYGVLTILAIDPTPGLQVGCWHEFTAPRFSVLGRRA